MSLIAAGSEGKVDRLVALGGLTRGAKRPLAPLRAIRVRGRLVSETIVDERGDRF